MIDEEELMRMIGQISQGGGDGEGEEARQLDLGL